MWCRVSAVVFGFLLLVVPGVQAETLSDVSQMKPESRIAQYLHSQQLMKGLFQVAVKVDQDLGLACKGDYQIRPVSVVIFSAIDLPDGAAQPTSGVWIYRYDAVRCQTTKRYNVLLTAQPGGVPEVAIFPPGNTIASPQLMETLVPAVLDGAERAVGGGCQDAQVFDTAVTQPPRDRDADATVDTGTWKEDWTVLACGKSVKIPLVFSPDGNGGTKFVVGQ